MTTRFELKILNGSLAGKVYPVEKEGLRLGRSSSNDIHIPDGELSRSHCFFELVRSETLRVTDLASANGTYVNGRVVEGDPVTLRIGDIVEVGQTRLRVGPDPESVPSSCDLGLGTGETAAPTAPAAPVVPPSRRSPWANLLWLVALLLLSAAAGLYFFAPLGNRAQQTLADIPDENPPVCEVAYEKVEANLEGIFRYALTLSNSNTLSVCVDDVPNASRHVIKSTQLGDGALAELREILAWKNLRQIDREYAGSGDDPGRYVSWSLKVVYASRVRQIRIVDTQEPDVFRTLREKLETFSKNELGIWAIQYSRDKLVTLARDALELARTKWEDRDTGDENLFTAIKACREALFDLETIEPKPDFIGQIVTCRDQATQELKRRCDDHRFIADRAINMNDWKTARNELSKIMNLVPDPQDDRHREARTKLVDVEKRIRKGEK